MQQKEDHDLLIRIDERVQALFKEVVGNGKDGLSQRVAKVDQRVSRLENFRYWLMGVIAVVAGAVTVLANSAHEWLKR